MPSRSTRRSPYRSSRSASSSRARWTRPASRLDPLGGARSRSARGRCATAGWRRCRRRARRGWRPRPRAGGRPAPARDRSQRRGPRRPNVPTSPSHGVADPAPLVDQLVVAAGLGHVGGQGRERVPWWAAAALRRRGGGEDVRRDHPVVDGRRWRPAAGRRARAGQGRRGPRSEPPPASAWPRRTASSTTPECGSRPRLLGGVGQAAGDRPGERRRRISRNRSVAGPSTGRRVARWYICSADSERSTLIHCTSSCWSLSCPGRYQRAGPDVEHPRGHVGALQRPAEPNELVGLVAAHRGDQEALGAQRLADHPLEEPRPAAAGHAVEVMAGHVQVQVVDAPATPRAVGPRGTCAGPSRACSMLIRMLPGFSRSATRNRTIDGLVGLLVAVVEGSRGAGDGQQRLPVDRDGRRQVDDEVRCARARCGPCPRPARGSAPPSTGSRRRVTAASGLPGCCCCCWLVAAVHVAAGCGPRSRCPCCRRPGSSSRRASPPAAPRASSPPLVT